MSSPESVHRLASKPYRTLAANAADRAELSTILEGEPSPDVLLHCLSGKNGRNPEAYRLTYIETLRHLLDILSPKFCVFTGSTSVYPCNDGSEVDETSPTGGTPTGDILVEAESLALKAGGAALRLGGIYGPGRARFIASARSGEPLPFGSPDASINLFHRDDAARALVHAAQSRITGVYNAVDDHPTRRDDLALAIRENLPQATAPASHDGPTTGKRVSNAKLKATGWTPLYSSILEAIRQDPQLDPAEG